MNLTFSEMFESLNGKIENKVTLYNEIVNRINKGQLLIMKQVTSLNGKFFGNFLTAHIFQVSI